MLFLTKRLIKIDMAVEATRTPAKCGTARFRDKRDLSASNGVVLVTLGGCARYASIDDQKLTLSGAVAGANVKKIDLRMKTDEEISTERSDAVKEISGACIGLCYGCTSFQPKTDTVAVPDDPAAQLLHRSGS